MLQNKDDNSFLRYATYLLLIIIILTISLILNFNKAKTKPLTANIPDREQQEPTKLEKLKAKTVVTWLNENTLRVHDIISGYSNKPHYKANRYLPIPNPNINGSSILQTEVNAEHGFINGNKFNISQTKAGDITLLAMNNTSNEVSDGKFLVEFIYTITILDKMKKNTVYHWCFREGWSDDNLDELEVVWDYSNFVNNLGFMLGKPNLITADSLRIDNYNLDSENMIVTMRKHNLSIGEDICAFFTIL